MPNKILSIPHLGIRVAFNLYNYRVDFGKRCILIDSRNEAWWVSMVFNEHDTGMISDNLRSVIPDLDVSEVPLFVEEFKKTHL